jgi:hypothetical protein
MPSYRIPPFPRLAAAAAALALLAACSDDPSGPGPDEVEDAARFRRLLVADATAPAARLLAVHADSTLATYALAGPASAVYATNGGRYAVVHQRTADRVQFLDGGVWTAEDAGHRRAPALLDFRLDDRLPTHENVNGDWVSVFFDGTGVARWVRESEMASGAPRVAFEAATGGAHHGGSFTAFSGSTPFFAHTLPNPAGGSPARVAVRNLAGATVAEADCPGMHGNGSISTGGVFGCNDGMVVVRAAGAGVTATHVTLAGDMAGLALRNAYTGRGGAFILGQFSALPGQPAQRVLATIDPATGALGRLPALPAGVTDHWRAVEPVRGQIVLLGTDGALYVYDGATRTLQHTVPGVVPAIAATGAQTHQVAVAEDLAAVASPTAGEVVLVSLRTGAVLRRIPVAGAPSRVAILGASRAGDYTLAP